MSIINKISFIPAVALMLSLNSCVMDSFSEDSPATGMEEAQEAGLYLSLNINPTGTGGTRADQVPDGDYYDDLDHEAGQAWENDIEEVLVILANPQTNKVITSVKAYISTNGGLTKETTVSGYDATYKVVRRMNHQEFLDGYNAITAETSGANAGKKGMMIFAVANPPEALWMPNPGDDISTLQKTYTVGGTVAAGMDPSVNGAGKFGRKGAGDNGLGEGHVPFLMSNGDYNNATEESSKSKYIRYLDADDLDAQGAYEKTIDFGSVDVQRALARIDMNFKFHEEKFKFGDREVTVSLRNVGLLNVNKNFNLFKETGTSRTEGNWGYFWSEYFNAASGTPRYVFDPYYTEKSALLNVVSPDFSTYFYSSPFTSGLFTTAANYDYAGTGDNGRSGRIFGTYDASGTDTYQIWRYTTPNTIHEANRQKNGITTGLAYIATLNFPEGIGTGVDRGTETPIYMWNGNFYWTNYNLQQIAHNPKNAEEKRMSEAYLRAIAKATEADEAWLDCYQQTKSDDVNSEFFRNYLDRKPSRTLAQALTEEGFSIFVPNDLNGNGTKEYTCVYYAWIKHNDNGNADLMGPMEFGIVRNTIYKLKVTGIEKIGHPIPDPEIPTDPDPIEPGTPDEEITKYISIDCQVLNWGLRVDSDVTLF